MATGIGISVFLTWRQVRSAIICMFVEVCPRPYWCGHTGKPWWPCVAPGCSLGSWAPLFWRNTSLASMRSVVPGGLFPCPGALSVMLQTHLKPLNLLCLFKSTLNCHWSSVPQVDWVREEGVATCHLGVQGGKTLGNKNVHWVLEAGRQLAFWTVVASGWQWE